MEKKYEVKPEPNFECKFCGYELYLYYPAEDSCPACGKAGLRIIVKENAPIIVKVAVFVNEWDSSKYVCLKCFEQLGAKGCEADINEGCWDERDRYYYVGIKEVEWADDLWCYICHVPVDKPVKA